MDTLLTAIIGFTQLVLGGMGVYVSLRPPKPEHHWRWISAFMGIGLVGVGLTGWLAERASSSQEKANQETHNAQIAATNANVSATNANNSALAAEQEVKDARDEAKTANDQLAQLISKKSKETNVAILNLGAETKASIKAVTVGPPPRRIPQENRAQLIRFLSGKPAKVRISALVNDPEAYRFAQDWYDVLQAAGWAIEENRIANFISVGPPQFGMVVKFHGEPVSPGQSIEIPNSDPAAYIGKVTEVLKTVVSGQRLPDVQEGLILLEFYARPPNS
ncbi:MAG TPA: hypothetical protein VJN89_01805 [Candidatus Acidoferrum sp.]|nr:hypothetical protein [Candidatus Acidoferrum sp.]